MLETGSDLLSSAERSSIGVSPVEQFLRLWRDGKRPDVVAHLGVESNLRVDQRAAVLLADQRLRWRDGERVTAEWYFENFPDMEGEAEFAIDLIYAEFLLLEGSDGPSSLDDFLERFPRFADAIRIQVAFHKALDRASGPAKAGEPSPGVGGGCPYPRVPGYEIVSELGRGGMGVVYLASQVGLKRRVALKMIEADGRTDPERLERFYREAEAAACLHHPNIAEIYEFGELDGCPYFSLELVEGADLAWDLASAPVSMRRAAQITETLARAMQYAHETGVIHRDLKPANILLTPEGVPKIADFGLAKLLGHDSMKTRDGTILGSPCYMSPEQATGNVEGVGPRSDVYSLGAILYEMITGSPPFRAGTAVETLQKQLSEDPMRPSRLSPKVPRDLETICLKCLEKSPHRRYGSAAELADDLDRFLNFESVRARPISATGRAWRWCLRKTSLAIAIGLASAGITTAVVLSISLAIYQYRANSRISKALHDVQSRQQRVDQLASHLAYQHGQSLCEQGDVGHGMLWLVRGLKEAAHARDFAMERALRLNLTAWRHRLHGLGLRIEHPGAVHAVAYSPDGRTVATAGADHSARLWDAETGTPIGLPLRHDATVNAIAFSPDGRSLLTGCDDYAVRLWSLDEFEMIGAPLYHDEVVYSVAFSPDGRTLASGSFDTTARLWDVSTREPIGRPLRHGDRVTAVAFSPDGRRLATGGWDKTARIWDVATGAPVGAPLDHKDWVWSVAFSPDGKTLLTGCYDQVARLWDIETGQPVGRPLRHQHCINSVAFSPDGKLIAVGCVDGTARLWQSATGEPIGTILRHRHTIASVAFRPDGRALITGGFDRIAQVWEVADSTDRSFQHDGFIRAMIFSPDGRKVLSASQDNTARLWDPLTGKPIGKPFRHDDSVEALAFSPDGRYAMTGSFDGTGRLWDVRTGEPAAPPLRHESRVTAVAISPDGRTVITGSEDKTARLWTLGTGDPIGEPLRHDQAVLAVAFSPDGRHALTGSADKTARLWDAATGAPVGKPLVHQGEVRTVAFSPDGQTILSGSEDMKARLWDVATGERRLPSLIHQGPVSIATFSPDGRTVVTGGWDRVARIWDFRTGLPEGPPLGHDGRLRALAISKGGESILTGSYDRSAQLWDKVTGLPLGPAYRHESQVWFVAFSPDGSVALSGGQEKTAHLWSLPWVMNGPVGRVELSVEVATGMALDDDGSLRFLDLETWFNRRAALRQADP